MQTEVISRFKPQKSILKPSECPAMSIACRNARLHQLPLATLGPENSIEQRRKPGSDLVLVLISFRDGFRGSFARAVLAFAATFVS